METDRLSHRPTRKSGSTQHLSSDRGTTAAGSREAKEQRSHFPLQREAPFFSFRRDLSIAGGHTKIGDYFEDDTHKSGIRDRWKSSTRYETGGRVQRRTRPVYEFNAARDRCTSSTRYETGGRVQRDTGPVEEFNTVRDRWKSSTPYGTGGRVQRGT